MTAKPTADRPRLTVLARWIWRRLDYTSRIRLIIAGILMLVAAGFDASVPVIIGSLVNGVAAKSKVEFDHTTISALLLIAAIMFGTQLFMVGRRQLVESVATAFERDTRINGLSHLMHLPGAYFTKTLTGATHERTARGIEGATKLLKLTYMDLLPASVLAVASVVVAFVGNFWTGLVMLGVIPTGLLLVRFQIRSQDGIRRQIRDVKERIAGTITELLPWLETVRANSAEPFFEHRIRDGAGQVRDAEMKHHRAMGWFDIAKYANETVWFVALLTVAFVLVQRGVLMAGAVLTVALLFLKVLTPLRELHRILDESAESAKQTADLCELLDEPADRIYAIAGTIATRPSAYVLKAENVTFDYLDVETGEIKPVLKGIDLALPPGTRTVLVGPSGCGKSTLLRLIGRHHHDFDGQIELFGTSITNLPQQHLSQYVGYVAQDAFLFRSTIRDNIVFGWDQPVTEDDLLEAATRAHIHEVIADLPAGYETAVFEGGKSLSGGQKQRLSLARALLRKPRLLLLDEATAALDAESHRAVQEAIDSLTDVTILEVAHRLSSTRTADNILVMDAGVIVQRGTYDELSTVDGKFRDLLASSQEDQSGVQAA